MTEMSLTLPMETFPLKISDKTGFLMLDFFFMKTSINKKDKLDNF